MLKWTSAGWLLFASIIIFAGCREKPVEGDRRTPNPRAGPTSDPALPVPEYYGVYAVENGKLVECRKSGSVKPYDVAWSNVGERALSEDPAFLPLVGQEADFLFFDKGLAFVARLPSIFCIHEVPDPARDIDIAEYKIEIAEYRSKPVAENADMVRLVPLVPLRMGRCGILAPDGTLYLLEVGDESSVASRSERFKKSLVRYRLLGILIACKIYARKNAGGFPPSIESLVASGDVIEEQLISPYDTRSTATSSFIYIGGHTDTSKSKWTSLIIYEDPAIHKGRGAHALFRDNTFKWLNADELQNALKETQANLRP